MADSRQPTSIGRASARALVPLVAILSAGCGTCGATGESPVVCVPPSLAAVLSPLRSQVPFELRTDTERRLARQAAAGDCDAVVLSDEASLAFVDARLVERRPVAEEVLVVAVAAHNDGPAAPEDLMSDQFSRIGIAGQSPAGRAAEAALRHHDLWSWIDGRLIRGENGATVAAWVIAGEADAGLVHRSAVASVDGLKETLAFEADTYPPVRFEGAAVEGPGAASALRVLESLQSPAGREAIEAAGLRLP